MKLNFSKIVIFALIIVGFILYSTSLKGPFLWDDYPIVVANQYIKDWHFIGNILTQDLFRGSGEISNWYRPLVGVSHAIDYSIWGLNSLGYHLINLLLHISSAILLYLLTLRLVRLKFFAFLASFGFLIHPLNSEAVSYISGRTDLLMVFFILVGILLFVKSLELNDNKNGRLLRISSYSSFVFALLSKETAIVFPVLLFLYLKVYAQEKLPNKYSFKNTLTKLWPYLALTALYLVSRLTVFNFYNVLRVSSDNLTYGAGVFGRFLMFLKALLIYYSSLILPTNLHYRMETSFPITASDYQVLISGLILVALSAASIYFWKRKPIVSFAILWFFSALIPVSGIFIPINFIVGFRWLYLAMIGPLIGLAVLLSEAYPKLKSKQYLKGLLVLLAGLYFIYLAFLTIGRNKIWSRPAVFFEEMVRFYPKDARLHNLLGIELINSDPQRGIGEFETAVKLKADFATPYFNLGEYHRNKKEFDKAIEYYQKAIGADEKFLIAYTAIASVYTQEKNYDLAASWLYRLLEIIPDSWKVYSQIGDVYLLAGDLPKAKEVWLKGLSLNPTNQVLRNKLNKIGQ